MRVGTIQSLESELYGAITYVWVAKYSLLGRAPDQLPCMDLFSRCHPKHVFGSYLITTDASCFQMIGDEPQEHSFFVALPLDDANDGWWDLHPDCAYRQQVKRRPRRGLPPVGVRMKTYARWVEEAVPCLVEFVNPTEIRELASRR